jgi:hypothetical protein
MEEPTTERGAQRRIYAVYRRMWDQHHSGTTQAALDIAREAATGMKAARRKLDELLPEAVADPPCAETLRSLAAAVHVRNVARAAQQEARARQQAASHPQKQTCTECGGEVPARSRRSGCAACRPMIVPIAGREEPHGFHN